MNLHDHVICRFIDFMKEGCILRALYGFKMGLNRFMEKGLVELARTFNKALV